MAFFKQAIHQMSLKPLPQYFLWLTTKGKPIIITVNKLYTLSHCPSHHLFFQHPICHLLLLEAQDHVVQDQTTLDPVYREFKIVIGLDKWPQFLQGLKLPFQYHKSMLNMNANLLLLSARFLVYSRYMPWTHNGCMYFAGTLTLYLYSAWTVQHTSIALKQYSTPLFWVVSWVCPNPSTW